MATPGASLDLSGKVVMVTEVDEPTFVRALVHAAVEATLRQHFSFEERAFAQSVVLSEVISVSDAVMGVHYGTEKIRFTAPVPSGSRVRLHAKLLRAEPRGPGVVYFVGVSIEVEGQAKPALVGEVVYLAAGAPEA